MLIVCPSPTDPHAYNDYEKFNFSHAQKPYLEFPVVKTGVYSGGSPGADRIVIGSIAEDYCTFCSIPSFFHISFFFLYSFVAQVVVFVYGLFYFETCMPLL